MATNAKKLLSGLEAEGISVSIRSLGKYMASNGVMVSVHVGRMRCYIPMTESAYGIDLTQFSEEGGSFYKERVSQSHLTFIPPADEAALSTMEKRLRRAVEVRTLTEGFMPMSAYDSLKKEFEKIRRDYLTKGDEIAAKWSILISNFKDGVKEMLKGIDISDAGREALLKAFMSQIPSSVEYRESFAMSLRVHAFPAESVAIPEGLNSSIAADMQSTWADEVVSTALLSIEKTVGEGWSKMLNSIRQYLNGSSIRTSSLNTLEKFSSDLSWKNIFKNPLLAQLSDSLKGISFKDDEDQAEILEDAIAFTYAYAKEVHLDLDFKKCPYSIEQLDNMSYVISTENNRKAG